MKNRRIEAGEIIKIVWSDRARGALLHVFGSYFAELLLSIFHGEKILRPHSIIFFAANEPYICVRYGDIAQLGQGASPSATYKRNRPLVFVPHRNAGLIGAELPILLKNGGMLTGERHSFLFLKLEFTGLELIDMREKGLPDAEQAAWQTLFYSFLQGRIGRDDIMEARIVAIICYIVTL